MTYCPWTEQLIVNTAGRLLVVKLLSLKHKVPCDLSVVFETNTEKPRKLDGMYDMVSVKKNKWIYLLSYFT